jgi:hypothetical protein
LPAPAESLNPDARPSLHLLPSPQPKETAMPQNPLTFSRYALY